MIRFASSVLILLSLSAAACGDGASSRPATSTATTSSSVPATRADASPGKVTPTTADEVAWMTALCALEDRADTAEAALPGIGQDASKLTLDQRRARAETIWPAQADLHDAFVASMRALTPPAGGVGLHNAITSRSQTLSAEIRRSLPEVDAIFASLASLEANNQRLNAAEQAANGAVDDAFKAAPALTALYESMPGCKRRHGPAQ